MRWLLVIVMAFTMAVGTIEAAPAAQRLTGVVENRRGVPLSDVDVTLNGNTVISDDRGRFLFEMAGPGLLTFERVAYMPKSFWFDGSGDWFRVVLPERIVRSIHVAGWTAAQPASFAAMLDIAASTSVNSLMIDIKNENGLVYHSSGLPIVASLGAAAADTYDLGALTTRAHSAGLYVVVRIVAFQDPIAARARPEWAARSATTGEPLSRNGQWFLDPTDRDPWAYNLALAEEVCALGVDEVQFDYVRFPDVPLGEAVFDGASDGAARVATITSFLEEARARLEPMGCATAADIFGWITNTPTDGGIGQHLETLATAADVLSPMIYPSHYSRGWYGFEVPNNHPGAVVTNASNDGLRRLGSSAAVLRPWLQDFWYSAPQVEEQVRAVDGLGLGWMLWNINSEFTVNGIPSDASLVAGHEVPPPEVRTLPASGFFDVGDDHVFSTDVAWLSGEDITRGCNPPYSDFFCPNDAVTRGQMAAFLVRALGLTVSGPGFVDSAGSVFAEDIARLAAAGITEGCSPPPDARFCPDDVVTRGQMAAFLVRALGLTVSGPGFVDSAGSVFAEDIARLAAAGITEGCSPPPDARFCPDDVVTRGQMAAFLYRTLGD